MKRIVIDTNVYSFLLRGRKDIAQFLSTYDSVLVPAVVLGELEAGFRKGSRYEQNETALKKFLFVPSVRVLDVSSAAAETYGRIYAELQAIGAMIPINDVWIAAQAMSENAPLVTFDAYFRKIAGLNLILKEV